jgi:hypothetical protein
MSDTFYGISGTTFLAGDWPDVLAKVAQLAAKDGLRLEITGSPGDADNLRVGITREPE